MEIWFYSSLWEQVKNADNKIQTLHTHTDALGSTANGWFIAIIRLFDRHK